MESVNKKLKKVLKHPFYYLRVILLFLFYRTLFKRYYMSDTIKGIRMITPQYISMGKRVYIGYNNRIQGVCEYNQKQFDPLIEICDNVTIQNNMHLTCANHILIGESTAIASNVSITDINHPYENIQIPIEKQDIEVSEVIIGKDCKIYNGVVILPGSHIGDHCVIGANTVVNINIPSYCVAVGVPVRIVKRYNYYSKEWEQTLPDGSFK